VIAANPISLLKLELSQLFRGDLKVAASPARVTRKLAADSPTFEKQWRGSLPVPHIVAFLALVSVQAIAFKRFD
jgi:hypothetical protein